MLRVGVIGLGEVSKVHIPIIEGTGKAELVAVCDIDSGLKEGYEHIPFYIDYKEMIEKEKPDCVHICLPHHLHFKVAKTCIENGVNVLLEKPLSISYKEGQALVELASRSQVKVSLCMQNRFNESVQKLIGLKNNGRYGKIKGIKGIVAWSRPKEYYDAKPWRKTLKQAGGGVMINQAIHTLDLMYYLCGEVDSLKGGIDNILYTDIEVEDTAYANLTFKNGARGLFFSTVANVENSSVELEVLFEKGKFRIKDCTLYEIKEDGSKARLIEDSKLPGKKFYYGASHSKLINKFYDCIIDNSEGYIHIREGLESIKIIDGIKKSSELNRTIRMEELQ